MSVKVSGPELLLRYISPWHSLGQKEVELIPTYQHLWASVLCSEHLFTLLHTVTHDTLHLLNLLENHNRSNKILLWALFYSMLEKVLGHTIWRMKSLNWMMNKSTDCSMIHFTPSISYFVQGHKDRWLGIDTFDITWITGFCYLDKKWGHCYLPKSKILSLSVYLLAC